MNKILIISITFFTALAISPKLQNNSNQKITTTGINQCLAITFPDVVVDDDWIGLPGGTAVGFPGDTDPHTIGIDAFPTINAAFAIAIPGSSIHIAPGIYTTTTVINKPIKIIGSGNGDDPSTDTVVQSTTSDIFTVQASNVTITNMYITAQGANWKGISVTGTISNLIFSDLHITACSYSVYFQYTANVSNVSIQDCVCDFTRTAGIYFQSNVGTNQNSIVNNLLIEGCVITDSYYGIYVCQPSLNLVPLRPNDFRNITVRNTRLERLSYKGIYMERLQDGLFDGLTMLDCGNDPVYASPNGLILNLKYADFSNITIQNSTFRRCGTTEKQNASCIDAGGRAEMPYHTNPATLTNFNIINCLVEGSTRGVLIGHTTNANVIETQIYGCTFGLATVGVINFLMERCAVMDNEREVLPVYPLSGTYGVAIAGRLYPSSSLGPFFEASNATIRYCVICNNQNAGLANADEVLNIRQYGFIPSSVDARYNWWGANDGPSSFGPGHGDPIGPATITYDPWLVMSINSSPTQILVGSQTSTVTARINTLSDGTTAGSTIMDGVLDITMSASIGTFGNGFQTISVPMVGGQAQASFLSATKIGLSTITAFTQCNPTYSTCQTNVTVIGKALLEVRKTARKSSLVNGESASFVITVVNRGNVPAINVTMTDIYPKELVFLSSLPSGSKGINSVNFSIGTLLPGAQATFDLTFILDDSVDLSSGKITIINESVATGYNFYSNEKTTSKDTATIVYSQPQPTPDMQINSVWKGLDTKNSTIGAGESIELQVSVEGCQYPCQIFVDWGDSQQETKSLDNPGFVTFRHTWTTGEFKVSIKASDAYGRTKFVTRSVTAR